MRPLTDVIPDLLQVLDEDLLLFGAHPGEDGATRGESVKDLGKVLVHQLEAAPVDREVITARDKEKSDGVVSRGLCRGAKFRSFEDAEL